MVDKNKLIFSTKILLILCLILCVGFAFALHTITTFDGENSYSVNESTNQFFNITINNTDIGQNANITSVNITFPVSFNFTVNTNGSSVGSDTSTNENESFVNATNTLSWTNSSYILNGTEWKYFWFNVTIPSPGDYNITVRTTNISGNYETNISVTVNDTTNPITLLGVNPVDAHNSSNSTRVFELKCSDNYNVSILQLWGNWSGAWHANQTNSTPVNNSYWNVTVSGIAEGTYVWGAYCNDSTGNGNWSVNRTLTIDTTGPTVKLPVYVNATLMGQIKQLHYLGDGAILLY